MNKIRLILYKLGLLRFKPLNRKFKYLENFRYSYPFGKKLSGEQQVYLDSNVFVKDKYYDFTIKKETVTLKPMWNSITEESFNYTSGMLYSNNKFKYGSFEAEIFIPSGYGLWSAFWLQGEDETGFNEIDIFEYYGKDHKFTYNTHYGKDYAQNQSKGNDGIVIRNLENSWHKYRLDWYPNQDLNIYIDDKLVGKRDGKPFTIPMNLIINCAVQNNIGNKLDKDLPTIMMVKNIRYYGIH